MRRINIKNLTPKQAWIEFVGTTEKMFLSNFRYEVPEMDIRKMCHIYSQEIPIIFEYQLFTTKQLEQIEELLFQHLSNYIDKQRGLDKLDLYTEEELDQMFQEDYEEIMSYLSYRFDTLNQKDKRKK